MSHVDNVILSFSILEDAFEEFPGSVYWERDQEWDVPAALPRNRKDRTDG